MLLRTWSLNWENGSRRSCIRDYEFLRNVLMEWTAHNRVVNQQLLLQTKGLVETIIAITDDDSNF